MAAYVKNADDPFHLPGPACVSFSGGRTSGLMLWSILERHDGVLPADTVVLFCNTGKERPETLTFIQNCSERWGVPIRWLEWQEGDPGFREVSYATADRTGEVFRSELLTKVNRRDKTFGRKPLPNPVARSCTANLKIRTKTRFVRSLGVTTFTNAIGFRADEERRVLRSSPHAVPGETIVCPLYDAGVDEAQVMAFWGRQVFDLQLQPHEGNCDLCFMKSRAKILRIMRDRPDLARWWIEAEQEALQSDRRGPFRIDRPSYAELLREAQNGKAMAETEDFFDNEVCGSHGCTD